jgi:ABC-2 type transport system ATP-binding protein
MIKIRKLTIYYSKGKNVIEDLDLELYANNIHGIVGLNGSGKTTLLNTIFGVKNKSKGEISYMEEKLTKSSIAYLPTVNYFYPHISGREYLKLFQNEEFDVNKWNNLFNLPLDSVIDTYSTGMKKKLALLGILKMDKPIMILDEPFNGLDLETNRIVRSILLKLKDRNKIIMVSSHIIETLTNMCDYIHHLEDKCVKKSVEKHDFQRFENEIHNTIEKKNIGLLNELL